MPWPWGCQEIFYHLTSYQCALSYKYVFLHLTTFVLNRYAEAATLLYFRGRAGGVLPTATFDAGQLQFFCSLERLREPKAFAQYLAQLGKAEWVVYSDPPFGGPEHVLNYLGRYTHRVAISNNRLLDIDNGKLTCSWKDCFPQAKTEVKCVKEKRRPPVRRPDPPPLPAISSLPALDARSRSALSNRRGPAPSVSVDTQSPSPQRPIDSIPVPSPVGPRFSTTSF